MGIENDPDVRFKWPGYVKCSKLSKIFIFWNFMANRQTVDNFWPFWTKLSFFVYFCVFGFFLPYVLVNASIMVMLRHLGSLLYVRGDFKLSFKKKSLILDKNWSLWVELKFVYFCCFCCWSCQKLCFWILEKNGSKMSKMMKISFLSKICNFY